MTIETKILIEERLKRIKNFLLLNVDFIPTNGFEEGKFGVCVFLFHYAIYFNDQNTFDIASNLFDQLVEDINVHEAINFRRGLSGYGYAIVSLILDDIVEVEDSGVLSEIDKQIISRISDIAHDTTGDGLLGVGKYLSLAAAYLSKSNIENDKINKTLINISETLISKPIASADKKHMINFLVSLITLNINTIESQKI